MRFVMVTERFVVNSFMGGGYRRMSLALSDGWQAAGDRVANFNTANEQSKRGVGIASCWYGCGNTALPNPSTVRLGVTPLGS